MADYNIGDPAYGSFGKFGRVDVKRGVVKNVTATGQVVVDFGEQYGVKDKPRLRRFGASGREHGYDSYSGGYLIDAEAYKRLERDGAVQSGIARAHATMRAARLSGAEDMRKLIADLSTIEAEISRLSTGAGS